MRLVVLADTHGLHDAVQIPPGDVLVHCGDLSRHGEPGELPPIAAWLSALPHPYKLLVAGNHDLAFEDPDTCRDLLPGVTILADQAIEIGGIRFYGTPWHPYPHGWAFSIPDGPRLRYLRRQIPPTDVLISHGPPLGVLDRTVGGVNLGCANLRERVAEIHPALHVFGHVHEAAGWYVEDATTFVNAAVLDHRHRLAQLPVVIDLAVTERRGRRRWTVQVLPPPPAQLALDL